MKTILFLGFFLFLSLTVKSQENNGRNVIYIFMYADVEKDGVQYRYFSPILDNQVKVNEKCLTEIARETLEIQAGNGARIGTIEFESTGTFEEAEDMILHKFTLPDKKVAYFKVEPDC